MTQMDGSKHRERLKLTFYQSRDKKTACKSQKKCVLRQLHFFANI